MILILLVVLLLSLIYFKITKVYSYWPDRGVKQRKQTYILGDNAGLFMKRESGLDLIINLYNAFPDERYMGMYQELRPTLLLRDPELIKRISVKDFDHFVDHDAFVPEGVDPLWTRNLLSLKGEKWHEMRSTLSPSFTSSKMKMMFTLVSECAAAFMEHLARTEQEIVSLELKDAFTRYANDVIATSAFGIKCNSLKDTENEFYVMGKKATDFSSVRQLFSFFVLSALPKLSKVFGAKIIQKDVGDFFTKIVTETIKLREKNNITRPDMLQLLIEAKRGKHKVEEKSDNIVDTGFATVEESNLYTKKNVAQETITDLDVTAQALIFFFAGFETVSSAMCVMGHELAANPEIQKKLREEVDDVLIECKGELTYEALMKMRYMDMVVLETLRLWPPASQTDRVCTKPYTIEPVTSDEKPVRLEIGDFVWIPVAGLHRDPKYFPNPEVFDPERFNDENKRNIQPYTYCPFGVGPWNCIGSRFALMEVKTLFFHLLSKFEFVPVEKTQIPLKLKPAFNILAENGFWIGLKRRSDLI